jgi:hypothetical protein
MSNFENPQIVLKKHVKKVVSYHNGLIFVFTCVNFVTEKISYFFAETLSDFFVSIKYLQNAYRTESKKHL